VKGISLLQSNEHTRTLRAGERQIHGKQRRIWQVYETKGL